MRIGGTFRERFAAFSSAVCYSAAAAFGRRSRLPNPAYQSPSAPLRRFGEHARVICHGLRLPYHDSLEIWMPRVEQPVVLVRGYCRRHDEQAVLRSLDETIAEAGQFRWGC